MAEKEQMLKLSLLQLHVVISMNPRHIGLEKWRCQGPDACCPIGTPKPLEYAWPQCRSDGTTMLLSADILQAGRQDMRGRTLLRLERNW